MLSGGDETATDIFLLLRHFNLCFKIRKLVFICGDYLAEENVYHTLV